MSQFKPRPEWAELNIGGLARNWVTGRSGAPVAASNSVMCLESLRHAINHLAAYSPQTIFSTAIPRDYSVSSAHDEILGWASYDTMRNCRQASIGTVGVSASEDTAYFFLGGDTEGDYVTPGMRHATSQKADSILFPLPDVPSYDWASGAVGQYATPSIRLIDIVVQQRPEVLLDTDYHDCVPASGYLKPVSPIRTTELDYVRRAAHDIRTLNQPMALCWSAQTTEYCESSIQASDYTGICITSDTPVNIFDPSETDRTTATPGASIYAYRSGRGNETKNTLAKIIFRARARVIDNSGDAVGYVRMIGPDHVPNNHCDIAITGADIADFGGTDDYIFANTASDWNDATTECNKIDIHGYVTSSDLLQIYGVFGWRAWM